MKLNWTTIWRKHTELIDRLAEGPGKDTYYNAYAWEGKTGQSQSLLKILRETGVVITWAQWKTFDKKFAQWYKDENLMRGWQDDVTWRQQQKFIKNYINEKFTTQGD